MWVSLEIGYHLGERQEHISLLFLAVAVRLQRTGRQAVGVSTKAAVLTEIARRG